MSTVPSLEKACIALADVDELAKLILETVDGISRRADLPPAEGLALQRVGSLARVIRDTALAGVVEAEEA